MQTAGALEEPGTVPFRFESTVANEDAATLPQLQASTAIMMMIISASSATTTRAPLITGSPACPQCQR